MATEFVALDVLQKLPRSIPGCAPNRSKREARYCESAYCDRCNVLRWHDGASSTEGVTYPIFTTNSEFGPVYQGMLERDRG